MSPSARALRDLAALGYVPWVVERRIRSFITRDLYNVIDILAIKGAHTLAVQVTAGSGHSARCKKVQASEYLDLMLGAGWTIQVWSYRKNAAGKYVQRVTDIGNQAEPAAYS